MSDNDLYHRKSALICIPNKNCYATLKVPVTGGTVLCSNQWRISRYPAYGHREGVLASLTRAKRPDGDRHHQ